MKCDAVHSVRDSGQNERKTLWVIGITAITMVAEIILGWLYGSMALFSDGVHMGTHTLALMITIFAYRISRKNAQNTRFAFGTGKVGVLGGYTSGVTLIIAAVFMVYESIHRFIDPVKIDFNEAIIVTLVGLGVNILSAVILGDSHGHDHDHKRDHNLNAAYLHVLTDALTSILAVSALLAGKYAGAAWLDPAVGIIGAAVILKWAFGLISDTAKILLDYEEDTEYARRARKILREAGAEAVEDIHVWQVEDNRRFLICTVLGDPGVRPRAVAALDNTGLFCHVTLEILSPEPQNDAEEAH
ncbi:MAG: CDF family Co(II)/Ni(II) efflux transporter DmeF [Fibrobacterota bacterium]